MADMERLFSEQLAGKNIAFKQMMQKHPQITADVDQLKQVFINLIQNAEQAIEPPGAITIHGKIAGEYEIRVSDDGAGITDNDLDSIFDLHFTTKPDGSGIGLFVVQQIMEAHNGTIEVESELGYGTTFILRFPMEKPSEKK
jgi:signal transduction histidine kinase